MKARALVVSTFALASASAAPAQVESGDGNSVCAVAARHSVSCTPTSRGAIFALTTAEVERLRPYALRAEARFQRFFGVEPPRYLFVSGLEPSLAEAGKEAGSRASLTWPSPVNRSDPSRIRKAVEVSLAKSGLTTEQIQSQADKIVAGAGLKTVAEEEAIDRFAIPHELGHILLLRHYWPDTPVGSNDYYASPFPDWLDEGAAQLMEAEGEEPFKRDSLLKSLGGSNPARPGSLSLLLQKSHPAERLKKLPPRPFWDEASLKKEGIESPGEFYAESAALAAFLLDRSGNERILAEIARSYADGNSFAEWLQNNGAKYRLGSTVEAMEMLWLDWLKRQQNAPNPA